MPQNKKENAYGAMERLGQEARSQVAPDKGNDPRPLEQVGGLSKPRGTALRLPPPGSRGASTDATSTHHGGGNPLKSHLDFRLPFFDQPPSLSPTSSSTATSTTVSSTGAGAGAGALSAATKTPNSFGCPLFLRMVLPPFDLQLTTSSSKFFLTEVVKISNNAHTHLVAAKLGGLTGRPKKGGKMALKQNITNEIIQTENRDRWMELEQKWGSINFGGPMPHEERNRVDKIMHALYVLEKWEGNGSADRILTEYGIPTEVREYVINKYCDGTEDVGAPALPKTKIADRYKELDQWAYDHPLEQVTPDGLVEVSGLSYASVMKYLKTAVRYKKVKNGLYEAFEDQHKVL
jgi:hypothetical protein